MTDIPREISRDILWLGSCIPVSINDETFHSHLGMYLLRGTDRTLLIDTGMPRFWPAVKRQLDVALGGRRLDYVFPTHPEVPHSANVPNILDSYPECRLIGDTRDYHLFYPQYVNRMDSVVANDEIDLGGLTFVFIDAVLKDLPSTLWGYERRERIMFVADGFAFLHPGDELSANDDPLHRPGDCGKLSSEIAGGLDVQLGEFIVKAALYWSRYVDPEHLFRSIRSLLSTYPTRMIAPAHSCVIDDVEGSIPIVQLTHENAYRATFAPRS